MVATVIAISKHRNYEHAYFRIYKKWIRFRRDTEYKSKGWALEPVPLLAANSPSLISIYFYEDLIEAYRIKIEIDSVTEFLKGKVIQRPEMFGENIY